MTGLVVLLIVGVFVTGGSGSRQGKWTGFTIAALSALAIVTITVVDALPVLK